MSKLRDDSSFASQISLVADQQRRPNRMEAINPRLLPLLRGERNSNPEPSATSPETALAPAKMRSQKCVSCREARQIFPFTMAFQPIVDIQDCRIDGYEALLRGINGEGAAQMLGQVTSENLYSFDQNCRVRAIELAAKLGVVERLNINFLPNAVYEPRACIQATLKAAERTGFNPRQLTFEIVETEEIADTPHLLNIIREYRRQGFKVAPDDFATGYSGLSRLADLRPDIVKLDRALIKDCDQDRTRLAIIASLLALGVEIGMKVVVEGVERLVEMDALRSVGARFMQGYYFAKPMLEGVARRSDIAWPVPLVSNLQSDYA